MNKSIRKSVASPFLAVSHTHAVGCRRRAFHKDLTCTHSKKPNLNKTLLCPHFSYPTRFEEHNQYVGNSWFICCSTARCSEVGRTCQACRHYVACFKQCGMGYTLAGGFQFAAQSLQINFEGVTNSGKRIRLTSEHLNALSQKTYRNLYMKSSEKNTFLKGNVGVFPIAISNPCKKPEGRKMRVCCSAVSSFLLACSPLPRGSIYPNSVSWKEVQPESYQDPTHQPRTWCACRKQGLRGKNPTIQSLVDRRC